MATSLSQLKSNRNNQFEKLTSELNKLSNNAPQNESDDNRFWKPEVDKAGNGYAIIRFLPAPSGEDIPFVRVWDHGFQGPGGWYIEKSLTTLNEKDPVSEYNTVLWNSGIESNKDLVRKQKRRLSYYSNIYIVKDPSNPANDGKVFLYKYGKKIFDKLNEAMNPEFSDETALNPFDLWEGANFKLKIRQVEGYRNYDKSEFDKPSPLTEDDDELEKIWKSEHLLQKFLDRSNFKTYDELKSRLDRAVNAGRANVTKNIEEEAAAPIIKSAPAVSAPWQDNDDELDDNLSFFKKLATSDE